uniref:Uncharacterized protein n=1 Tax=Arundo donax TaxID=35708 RepID=A0A0A9FWG7_ARUDO
MAMRASRLEVQRRRRRRHRRR